MSISTGGGIDFKGELFVEIRYGGRVSPVPCCKGRLV